MTNPYWPLHDLRLCTRDLVLRPTREGDLAALADVLPADVELDPSAARLPLDDERVVRGAILQQEYWRAVGSWRVEEWKLPFTVLLDEVPVGQQWLEGSDFPRLRTVDTASWLVAAARGRGYGTQMRAAVLELAFGSLGAEHAVTSAWPDNAGSLGVSRHLGYAPNGVSALWREGVGLHHLEHYRLSRAAWAGGAGIAVTDAAPCLPLFGR